MKKLPSIFEVKPWERFIRPVSMANIEDSILDGIILANRTIPGSRKNASCNKSVTVDVMSMKARGLRPKYICLTNKMQPADPRRLVKQAMIIMR